MFILFLLTMNYYTGFAVCSMKKHCLALICHSKHINYIPCVHSPFFHTVTDIECLTPVNYISWDVCPGEVPFHTDLGFTLWLTLPEGH